MKNNNSKNFTKLTQKKGISLIVLIVTIIVIIILAAVIILAIDKNNPVESAREAKFKEDIQTFRDDLALSISKDYVAKAGQRDNKFNATTYDKIKEYIPSFTKEYEGKLVIEDDELMYQETEKVTEKEKNWFEDFGIKEKIAAKTVYNKAQEYYGKSITNYDVNGVGGWKIFYSDGNNVYIIASDYVDVEKIPAPLNGGSKPTNTNAAYPKGAPFNNVLAGYSGSSNIIDEKIKALNNDYFNVKGYTSTSNNMKVVAYMLDTEIWSGFVDKNIAEYAIGGPTVEVVMASYSKSHNVKYRAYASNNKGYQISKDDGASWNYGIGGMLSTSDSLYVLPIDNGANAMWLASSSAGSTSAIMGVASDGGVYSGVYNINDIGFRPLVCLKSNVLLEVDGEGYKIK